MCGVALDTSGKTFPKNTTEAASTLMRPLSCLVVAGVGAVVLNIERCELGLRP